MAKLFNWCRNLHYGLLILVLGYSLPTKILAADYSSHAYSVYPSHSANTKISPIKSIALQPLSSQTAIAQAVTDTLNATRTMPAGYKALINLDLDFYKSPKPVILPPLLTLKIKR